MGNGVGNLRSDVLLVSFIVVLLCFETSGSLRPSPLRGRLRHLRAGVVAGNVCADAAALAPPPLRGQLRPAVFVVGSLGSLGMLPPMAVAPPPPTPATAGGGPPPPPPEKSASVFARTLCGAIALASLGWSERPAAGLCGQKPRYA